MSKKTSILSLTALVGLSLAISSCGNDENPTITSTTTRFSANLTGAGEKPTSTTSTATGTFVGNLDETTRVLSYTVTYQGFSEPLTGGHLHRIDSTKTDGTGPVDIPFPSLTSPITGSTTALSPLQVYRIKAGQYYANLHTKTYPGGEIRGEVRKQ